MKCKAQGDDLNGSLETEYSNKVGLCVVLSWKSRVRVRRIHEITEFHLAMSIKSHIGQSLSSTSSKSIRVSVTSNVVFLETWEFQ